MGSVTVNFLRSKGTINRNIYGHFAEHIGGVFYDGLWVGESSQVENMRGFRKTLVESFRKLNPPVLRWPGGCFAELYDWRDGIGPRESRPVRAGWWYAWDQRTESNAVGTHEFIDFCRMVGAEPYFAANMTTVTPLHIRNWMEYCHLPADTTTLAKERAQNGAVEPFGVRYWGIGNENWGGGGQMTPEQCAREYIRFTTVCNSLDRGAFRFIMCGANGHDIAWTRRLMQEWKRGSEEAPTYGMSVHYYTNQGWPGDPIHFAKDDWYLQMFNADYMQRVLDDHRAAMDEFDPERKIGLIIDEWGNWHRDGTGPSNGYNLFEQQSNMRDAVVAAMTLNMFNNRCDSVIMANVAQLCNNLHSLYLASGDQFVETPNYHVFDMFKAHQDAHQLETIVDCPVREMEAHKPLATVSASASEKEGVVTITLCNLDLEASETLTLNALGRKLQGEGSLTVLAHEEPRTVNSFENPYAVVPVCVSRSFKSGDSVTLPPASVATITISMM